MYSRFKPFKLPWRLLQPYEPMELWSPGDGATAVLCRNSGGWDRHPLGAVFCRVATVVLREKSFNMCIRCKRVRMRLLPFVLMVPAILQLCS